jgi:hypothetical protein
MQKLRALQGKCWYKYLCKFAQFFGRWLVWAKSVSLWLDTLSGLEVVQRLCRLKLYVRNAIFHLALMLA